MSPLSRIAIAVSALAVAVGAGWLIGHGAQRTVLQTATPASLVRTTVTRASEAGPNPVMVSVPGLAEPSTRSVSTGGSGGSGPISASTTSHTTSTTNVQTNTYTAPNPGPSVTHGTTTTTNHTQPTVQGGQHGG